MFRDDKVRDFLKKGAPGLESEGDPKIKVFRDGKVRETLKLEFSGMGK